MTCINFMKTQNPLCAEKLREEGFVYTLETVGKTTYYVFEASDVLSSYVAENFASMDFTECDVVFC